MSEQTKTAPAPAPAPAPAANGKPAETKPAETKPAELGLDFISGGAFMLTSELSTVTAPVRARSDKQKVMDKKVKELHAAWIKANKPSTWDALVKANTVATYFVQPDQAAELHKLINRAVALHELRVRWGTSFKVTDAHIKRYNLPANYLGREAVSFAIQDKRPRATSGGKSASEVVEQAPSK